MYICVCMCIFVCVCAFMKRALSIYIVLSPSHTRRAYTHYVGNTNMDIPGGGPNGI